ncbi:MAG: hypothetical protein IT337_17050, partial [Thermomicrobiales bacterium]|nr:hypothetical protein [Thermomicrobiales bacterium]
MSPVRQSQFALPEYLRRERDATNSLALETESKGGGPILVGTAIAGGVLLFDAPEGIGLALLGFGVALTIVGFWRLRRDTRAMERVGLAMCLAGAVALAFVVAQLAGPAVVTPPAHSGSEATVASPTAEAASAAESARPLGTVSMFRGNAAHTGVNPG